MVLFFITTLAISLFRRDNILMSVTMEKKGNRSLKEEFTEKLRDMILSGSLRPGEKLPPERELSARYGISRGCISQAVLDLERAGFLEIVPRQGTFVAHYNEKATPDTVAAIMKYNADFMDSRLFSDFLELSFVIERECVREACINFNVDNRILLEKYTKDVLTADEESAPEAFYQYHRNIAKISGNGAYYMLFVSFEKLIRRFIRAHYNSIDEINAVIPILEKLTESIKLRDVYGAESCHRELHEKAAAYINARNDNKEEAADSGKEEDDGER